MPDAPEAAEPELPPAAPLPEPVVPPGRAASAWRFYGLALLAGGLGAALNYWAPLSLLGPIHLAFGSIPVYLVALTTNGRAGALAGALAAAGLYALWREPIVWVLYPLAGALVGRFSSRGWVALLVLAVWLVGLPLANLVGQGLVGVEGAFYRWVIWVKTPLNELFSVLVALFLCCFGSVRRALRRLAPAVHFPPMSLSRFQLDFVSLLILGAGGTLLVVFGRQFYADQRYFLQDFDRYAAQVAALQVEGRLRGYHESLRLAGLFYQRLTPEERVAGAQRVLARSHYRGLFVVDQANAAVKGWWSDADGAVHPVPPWLQFGALGEPGAFPAPGEVKYTILQQPRGQQTFALLQTPIRNEAGQTLGVAIDVTSVALEVQRSLQMGHTYMRLYDGQGRLVFDGRPPGVPSRPRDITASAVVGESKLRVVTTTPEGVLTAHLNRALLEAVLPMLGVLLILGGVGYLLMGVLARELRHLSEATRHLGEADVAAYAPRDSFLAEVRSLYATYEAVSRSLQRTMRELRTREAELSLANSQLSATVEELEALEQGRSELFNAISHDIKIPLTAVVGYTELLEDEAAGPLQGEQRAFVQGIENNAQRVVRLLEDLLDLSRLGVGHFPIAARPVAVCEALEAAGRNLAPLLEQKHLTLAIDCPADLPPALADPGRLDQILNNLLSNAIKFTPEGGHVWLSAQPESAGGPLWVAVRDDGIGIAAADQVRLFERFYRVQGNGAPGTGLGLAISKKLVEAMGGQLTVESAPGRGSLFAFSLPGAAAVPEGAAGASGAPESGVSWRDDSFPAG